MSSYDPKHAIGSCLNPASIEISLAEIKSEPGEGQGLRIFPRGQFSYRAAWAGRDFFPKLGGS